ncbi:MAG: hypothetical protein VX700_06320 [Pseudomonadota bacterium]|nr:hypothetical protein [Pseudomonadota bacterium]
MLIYIWVVAVLSIAPFFGQSALSQTFFSAIEDLPIAPGLIEAVDEGVSFGSVSGRIVTAIAYGGGDIYAYRGFYKKALPALGWRRGPDNVYRRDQEALSLDFENRNSLIKIRIRVVPASSEKVR